MAEKREHSIHVRLCDASDVMGYVIGVVAQASDFDISNVGSEE